MSSSGDKRMAESELLSPEVTNEPVSLRKLLANRDYSRLWFGQVVSNIGSAISSLALLFFAYALTGSAISMAILAIIQTAPVVIFAGFVGVYVDRFDRKKIMIASDIIRAIAIIMIPVSINFSHIMPEIYWIYLFTFIYSCASVWFFPSRSASIPNLVEGEELVAANSLAQMTFQIVQLIVPPIGGMLVAFLAPDYFFAFAIEATTFVISAISLSGISRSLKPVSTMEKESLRTQIVEGARIVTSNSILSFLFVFAIAIAGSSGIFNALLVPFLEADHGLGPSEMGFLLALGAASGALTAYYFGRKKELVKPLYLVSLASLIAGVSCFIIALATDLTGILIGWVIIGCVDVLLNIPLSVLMQRLVQDEFRGRVFALLNVAFTTFQVAGMGIGGVWAEAAGSSIPAFIGAGLGLLVVGILGFLAVARWHLHRILESNEDDTLNGSDDPETITSPVTI